MNNEWKVEKNAHISTLSNDNDTDIRGDIDIDSNINIKQKALKECIPRQGWPRMLILTFGFQCISPVQYMPTNCGISHAD